MMKTNKHAMTLRLDPDLDDLLTEVCWGQRTTKAAWIRAAIRQALGLQNQTPQRLRKEPTLS
jgi:predicted transcriptional regulator